MGAGNGYPADFSTGIVVGILLGMLGCAVISAVLFSYVRRLSERVEQHERVWAGLTSHREAP